MMLSAEEIIEHRNQPTPDFPAGGSKQFEPDGSYAELCDIQNTLLETKKLISFERVRIAGSLSQAVWHPELQLAEVTVQTGSHWLIMGHVVDKKLYLFPEEALYLLEVGAIEIMYNNLPLSIQRAYSVLLKPKTDMSLEKYRVYSRLNSHGYKVLRHDSKNSLTKYEKQLEIHKIGIKHKDLDFDTRKRKIEESDDESAKKLKSQLLTNFKKLPIKPGCNDLKEVLDNLKIFSAYTTQSEDVNIDFDAYLMPSSKNFKKSSVQLPNFRIRVFGHDESVPGPVELLQLSKMFEDEVPIIHAVVFPDHISFYNISSIDLPEFTSEKDLL